MCNFWHTVYLQLFISYARKLVGIQVSESEFYRAFTVGVFFMLKSFSYVAPAAVCGIPPRQSHILAKALF